MKLRLLITHPYTLIISFLFILISGEHLGGFYAFYLLLALPSAGIHSLLAFAGIILLIVNHYQRNGGVFSSKAWAVVGAFLLLASLMVFFLQEGGQYNWGTFFQLIPLLTIAIFVILFIMFILELLILRKLGNKREQRFV